MSITTKPTCQVIRPAESYEGEQGFSYFEGLSSQSVGAQSICMHMLTVPPGGRAKAHLHESHETCIYVLSGVGDMWYGENLGEHMKINAGEFLYIPAGVPHLPMNLSETETLVAVVARTDPNEQESVVLLPELDALVP